MNIILRNLRGVAAACQSRCGKLGRNSNRETLGALPFSPLPSGYGICVHSVKKNIAAPTGRIDDPLFVGVSSSNLSPKRSE